MSKNKLLKTYLLSATGMLLLVFFLLPKDQPKTLLLEDNSLNPEWEAIKKLPKYDRPDLAVMQNNEMIREPSTRSIPMERALNAFSKIKRDSKYLKAIGGVTWEERGPDNVGGRTRGLMFDPNDPGTTKVWAGGVAGGLWYNDDITSASTVWQNVDDFWANLAVCAITYDPTNTQVFYVGTGEGYFNADAVRGAGIWKSTDGGATWNQLPSTDNSNFHYVQKIVVTSNATIIAATRAGLYRSTDGGANWTTLFSGRYADIELASNGDLYASQGIFSTGVLRKSTNDGVSWTDVTPATGGQRIEIAIAPSNSNVVYAVASNNTVVGWFKKSTDGGSTWTDVTIPPYVEQSCVNSTTNDFARGQAWYDLILSVHPTNPDIALVGGIDIYKTTNGGSTWGLVSYWTGACDTYVHADQHAMQFSPANSNVAIFGTDGGVFYSTDVGSSSNPSFVARNNGYNVTQFYAGDQLNSNGSNYMLAGSQDNGSHQFTGPGINSTTEVTGGDGAFCHIDQLNSNIQVTSFVFNVYFRSTNGGASFSTILSNQSFGRFINPTDYDDDAKVLYCAANEDQYIRIINMTGSTSAFLNSVNLGGFRVSAVEVSPYTANRIFLGTGTSGGGGGSKVFLVDNADVGTPTVTEIGTASLPANGYISSIDVGSSDDQLIITYSNFGITSVWETRNGGTTWVNREGDLPDIPVRWALYNPDNTDEVLLATELGVWSTDNVNVASPDWGVTNTGLANVRCDMLAYRESDGKVMVSTHGRGAYTADPFDNGGGEDTEPPSTPTNLTASNITTASFDVSWDASTDNVGVTGYNVYLNGGLDGTTTSTSYSFSGLAASTTYNVAVEAFDAAANTSGQATTDVTTNDDTGGVCDTPISSFPFDESFESGTTGWIQETTDDLDWTRDANGTPSSNTGPSNAADGTFYLYIESSGNGTGYPNKNAIISSPCMNVNSLAFPKLDFSYHMFGSSMGSLVVETSVDGGATWTSAWSISGDQGNQWNSATIDLPSSNSLQIRFNGTTGSSWRSDIAVDAISVYNGTSGPPPCPAIEFSSVLSYGGSQDAAGNFSIQDGGATLLLENNTWKYISLNYTVTTNTVLDFEFKSTSEGEIHGIGFDTDNSISSNLTFKVHGSQNWGITNFDNYSGTDWVQYSIPVGSFFTGSFDRLFFTNDNDAGSGNNSYFRNVTVHEGTCGTLPSLAARTTEIVPIIGNDGEYDLQFYPNPVRNELNVIHNIENGSYSILTLNGKVMESKTFDGIEFNRINTFDLPRGMYMLKIEHAEGSVIHKFVKY